LRDTLSTDADRFKNYRRTVLVTFPNGGAPLTALLSLTESEATDDPDFYWYEFPLPTQRSTLSADAAPGAASITVADQVFRAGHIIRNTTTNEIAKVLSVTNNANGTATLSLLRGKAMGASDALIAAVAMTSASSAPTSRAVTRSLCRVGRKLEPRVIFTNSAPSARMVMVAPCVLCRMAIRKQSTSSRSYGTSRRWLRTEAT